MNILRTIKRRLYFLVATYFAFWAKFVLRRWKPRIIVVTGSSGKTTTLHLLEAQIGDKALYSHHANSAIGIPFHILGMSPNVLSKGDWISRFILAPFYIFRRIPDQKIYVVEADCDRPHEGFFTSKFLKPEVVIWVSVSRTHSMNFDRLVKSGQFPNYESAIAHEFGYFVEQATKLVLVNGDQEPLISQLDRRKTGVTVKQASVEKISRYQLTKKGTVFNIGKQVIKIPGLQPKKLGVSLQLIDDLLSYLKLPIDLEYMNFTLPPGRSNFLNGKKDTVLIDSTYNTGMDATAGLLELFSHYPAKQKWLVVGDILEQGGNEKSEHEELANLIMESAPEHVILLGSRTKKYTYPLLKSSNKIVNSFTSPKAVLDYLEKNIKGGEAILFKGAQGLEGVVEQLLADPKDSENLVRREASWVKRRQGWGLPR
jgi:UDP-N-acetylmuramoyl-tripeptide--D-alanyl-D-alanine ligase